MPLQTILGTKTGLRQEAWKRSLKENGSKGRESLILTSGRRGRDLRDHATTFPSFQQRLCYHVLNRAVRGKRGAKSEEQGADDSSRLLSPRRASWTPFQRTATADTPTARLLGLEAVFTAYLSFPTAIVRVDVTDRHGMGHRNQRSRELQLPDLPAAGSNLEHA